MLPKNNPTQFCKAFIQRELDSFKEEKIYGSYWGVMERIIARADEMSLAFDELVKEFGYSDKFEGYPPDNSYVWLVLEHIWLSVDYAKDAVSNAKERYQDFKSTREKVAELSFKLAEALRELDEDFENVGLNRSDFQASYDVIQQAGENNYLFKSYVSDEIEKLSYQYDLKYWPSRSDLVYAIGDFESSQPDPTHYEYPEDVLMGRSSDIKNFVISFDSQFKELNDLPESFRFSNNAMAEIINIVLDRSPDNLVAADAVKTVRHRYLS